MNSIFNYQLDYSKFNDRDLVIESLEEFKVLFKDLEKFAKLISLLEQARQKETDSEIAKKIKSVKVYVAYYLINLSKKAAKLERCFLELNKYHLESKENTENHCPNVESPLKSDNKNKIFEIGQRILRIRHGIISFLEGSQSDI